MSCSAAATWSAFGLPAPDTDGYGYQIGLGLVRTEFADGSTRQRRRWTHWPRAWAVQWTVTADVLHTLSAWLAAFGSDWGALPLLSGEDADGNPTLHQVRLIDDPDIQHASGGLFRLRVQLEQASGITPADITGWALPCASLDGYSYTERYGLQRSAMDAANRRQRRDYTQRPRLYQVRWQLTRADLARAEAWLNAYGCAWGSYQLLDSESAAPFAPNIHTARLAADPRVSLTEYDAVLSAVLETACGNEAAALDVAALDNASTCLNSVVSAVDLGLDGAGLAAGWGDSTDWGGRQP